MLIVVIIIHYSKDILRGVPPQPNKIGNTELSEIQINTLNKLSQVEYTIDPNILELFNDLWNDPVRSGISSPLVIITLFSSSFLLYGPGGPTVHFDPGDGPAAPMGGRPKDNILPSGPLV